MAIEQLDLLTGLNKVDFAINLLKIHEPPEGYYLADSGGKDSSVLRDIIIKSGVKFDSHYCVSPIDPPQIYKFLKEYHPDTQWDYHAKGFWKLVEKNSLPTRLNRWCCRIIKEAGGIGRSVVVGNRSAESTTRKHQGFIEGSLKSNVLFIRPILQFTDYDVWQYIRENDLSYCYLYDEGAKRKGYGEGIFKRLGCILCPFSGNSLEREMVYFPKTVKLWEIACNRIVNKRLASGNKYKRDFETGEELFNWWISRKA